MTQKCLHINNDSSVNACILLRTRHRANTSTRWHFAFGATLSATKLCTYCKSAQ